MDIFSLTGAKRTFLGFQPSFDEADAVVIPVPYDSTVSYGTGARSGPSAMIDASSQLERYDIDLGCEICDNVKAYTMDELEIDKSCPEKSLGVVESAVAGVMKLGKKPVVFGGEHSITAGAVAGLKRKDISVLQFDAHSDLRDSYEGTRYSHACAMRRVREKVESAVQVGIRAMCLEEA